MKPFIIIIILNVLLKILNQDCQYDDYYRCDRNHESKEDWDKRCFQTPYIDGTHDPVYKSTYQYMHYLVGYAQQKYSEDKELCKITFYYKVNEKKVKLGIDHKILFYFGGIEQESNYFIITKENDTYPNGLSISARIVLINTNTTFASLILEEEYFIWNVPELYYDNEIIREKGQKGAIVELFGWPYQDIIEESDFLNLAGYLGVKITPPNEYVLTENWIENEGLNPWQYFYQPVSYKLKSRLGDKKDLKDLIYKCRYKGIRIYSQVVINQMTYQGNDIYKEHANNCGINENWPGKTASAGSPFFTLGGRLKGETGKNFYSEEIPIFEYPAVPYCGSDFHCKTNNDGSYYTRWVDGSLHDLDTSKEYVQQRIADFLTELISLGITGFSIYNGKFISNTDYAEIFEKLKNNLGNGEFPDDFIIIIELIFEYTNRQDLICNKDFEENFSTKFKDKLSEKLGNDNDVNKIKIQAEEYETNNPNCDGEWTIEPKRFVLSIENQNLQRDCTNNEDTNCIKNRITGTHYEAYTRMFNEANDYKIRKIFSSYSLPCDETGKVGGSGFPDGKSDSSDLTLCIKEGVGEKNCGEVERLNVPYVKAFKKLSTGYDSRYKDNWICSEYTRVHRRLEIVNAMREWMGLSQLTEEDYLNLLNERLPEISKITTTTPTTIPTTILTTIPTTILTTIPTTILTIIPTTITTTIPTTIPTTILTTIPTTIPTTISTTIPTTILVSSIVDNIFETIPTTIAEIINTSIPTSYITSTITNIINDECPEKCQSCNQESNNLNLCISCNTNRNYYPVFYNNDSQPYVECLSIDSSSSNLKKLFFNPITKTFNLCYETCKTCYKSGDPLFHNCITCDTDHMFRPDESSKDNCVTECKYYYYFNHIDQYKCTKYPQCPEDAKLLIKEKNKCVDDCIKDSIYKYQYNGNCLIECPEDTINDNYLCKIKDTEICSISLNNFNNINFGNVEESQTLIKSYTEEFSYTNNHISQYKNNEYNMIIYQNSDCISELSLTFAEIDFGNCYNKLKENYNIDNNLTIALVENYKNLYKNKPTISYGLYNPKTGEKLKALEICQNETIIINENLLSLLNENNTNYETMIDLINQNINIFDPEDDFYTDLCFYFISPIKKDIPLKDRLEAFYPNITLCDSGCKNIGVNFTTKSAICECKYNDILNNDISNNDLLGDSTSEILEIVENSNIEVLKCLFKAFKHFKKKYGGYIILSFTFLAIIFTIFFYCVQFNKIKLYIFELTKNYLNLLSQNTALLWPPKKKRKKGDDEDEKYSRKKKFARKTVPKHNIAFQSKNTIRLNEKLKIESEKSKNKYNNNDYQEFEKFKQNESNNNSTLTQNNEIFFNDYLSKSIDEMDFDAALKYDKRGFMESFYDLIMDKVMTINTFCSNEPLKPLFLKIVVYILYINLFFIVNGFFFSESYISQVYHLEKEDKFFTFVPRSISRFFYTIVVGEIVNFLIGCFFTEEKKIKRIFIREKENSSNVKYEIIELISKMKKRLIAFFIIIFIIFIFSFLYVICFNYVYHFTQIEWIKSSIFIFIIIELLIIILSLIITVLRFLSIKCKSERIFKLSNLINEI